MFYSLIYATIGASHRLQIHCTTDNINKTNIERSNVNTQTHTRLTALCPELPGWASTRKVKSIWISLKQETMSSSGISWAICKYAPHSRQITMPANYHSVFYRLDALPAAQPTESKHWRHLDKPLNNKVRPRDYLCFTYIYTRLTALRTKKTYLDFTEATGSKWQWHQLGHMQVCISLQTDKHASTPPLIFYRPDALPAAQPTVSKH